MIKLSDDTDKMDQMLSDLNNYFKYNKNNDSIIVNKNALPGDKINTKDYTNNLNYDWSNLINNVNLVMKKSDSILNQHDKDLAKYKNYVKDKNDENNFKDFKSTYNENKKMLKAKIIDIPNFEGKYLSLIHI